MPVCGSWPSPGGAVGELVVGEVAGVLPVTLGVRAALLGDQGRTEQPVVLAGRGAGEHLGADVVLQVVGLPGGDRVARTRIGTPSR